MHANLIRLSIQRVTGKREPKVYDNDTRARMLRSALPSPKYNAFDWQKVRKS